MNDTARITCSIEANDTKNNGNTPTERRYFDLGKKVLIVWENAINQYPIVCIAIPIAKKAIVSRNNVGLPVFLNPIYEITPIIIPTEKPIRFRIISNKNSNVANLLAVLNKVWEQVFWLYDQHQSHSSKLPADWPSVLPA